MQLPYAPTRATPRNAFRIETSTVIKSKNCPKNAAKSFDKQAPYPYNYRAPREIGTVKRAETKREKHRRNCPK